MNTDRVAAAIAEGALWRAKQILSGRLASGGFDAKTCEQLGAVLLQMGDTCEAGRYLFASGRRRPEYQPAINLFVARHRGGTIRHALPRCVRRLAWARLPEPLQDDLIALGLQRAHFDETVSTARLAAERGQPGKRAGARGVGLLVVLAILGIPFGLGIVFALIVW